MEWGDCILFHGVCSNRSSLCRISCIYIFGIIYRKTNQKLEQVKKLIVKHKSELSTILGIIVAIANSYANIDWETFTPDYKHIMPLIVSAVIAIGGYMTSINIKNGENN